MMTNMSDEFFIPRKEVIELAAVTAENDALKAELASIKKNQAKCPTCGESEPFTGNCGTSGRDTKALCKRAHKSVGVPLEAENEDLRTQGEPVGYAPKAYR